MSIYDGRKTEPNFITLEGGEGSGKTTQSKLLVDVLNAVGLTAILTHEPGGSDIGEQIRAILKEKKKGLELANLTEILLFLAERAQHIERVIKPAMQRGDVIICDRYHDSTIAYQLAARGLDGMVGNATAEFYNAMACHPGLTLLYDVPVEVGLKRARKRNDGGCDRFDDLDLVFHTNVRKSFLEQAKADPLRYRVIDANNPVSDVFAKTLKEVFDHLRASSD